MHYLGGKSRIARHICPVLQDLLNTGKYTRFVDAFAGSMNIVSGITFGERVANDINPYVIAVYRHALEGGAFPSEVSLEEHTQVKNNPDAYPDWYVGFVGFGCSFGGVWFHSYIQTEKGNVATGTCKSIARKAAKLQGVKLFNVDYSELEITPDDLVYCDIPYKGTVGYSGTPTFDHDRFYTWAYNCPATVVVSEYERNLVPGSKVIWSGDSVTGFRNSSGKCERTREVLMLLK